MLALYLHLKNAKKLNSFDFGIKLTKRFAMPFVMSRPTKGLRKLILEKVNLLGGNSVEKRHCKILCHQEIEKNRKKINCQNHMYKYCGKCLCSNNTINVCKGLGNSKSVFEP